MQELDIKQSVSDGKLSERVSTGCDCALSSLETGSQDDTTRQDAPYRGACFCCLMLSTTHSVTLATGHWNHKEYSVS